MSAQERFVREKEATAITGMSRTTRWRKEKAGQFPQKFQISDGLFAYRLTELQEWVNRQIAKGIRPKRQGEAK